MKGISDLIGYCGLYCGACSFKVAHDENERGHLLCMPSHFDKYKDMPLQPCPGCKLDRHGSDCKIRDCAKSRELSHCGLCTDFPCDIITAFNNDGLPHHAEVIENLTMLRDSGEEQWLRVQEQKWRCPCGAKLSWYVEECLSCGKPVK